MTTNCLRDRFRRVCKWTGVRYRSCHKLRKTYGTIVQDAGFDENLITSIMGHTDIRTSETFYHFDRKTDEMKQERINSIGEFQRAQ